MVIEFIASLVMNAHVYTIALVTVDMAQVLKLSHVSP